MAKNMFSADFANKLWTFNCMQTISLHYSLYNLN